MEEYQKIKRRLFDVTNIVDQQRLNSRQYTISSPISEQTVNQEYSSFSIRSLFESSQFQSAHDCKESILSNTNQIQGSYHQKLDTNSQINLIEQPIMRKRISIFQEDSKLNSLVRKKMCSAYQERNPLLKKTVVCLTERQNKQLFLIDLKQKTNLYIENDSNLIEQISSNNDDGYQTPDQSVIQLEDSKNLKKLSNYEKIDEKQYQILTSANPNFEIKSMKQIDQVNNSKCLQQTISIFDSQSSNYQVKNSSSQQNHKALQTMNNSSLNDINIIQNYNQHSADQNKDQLQEISMNIQFNYKQIPLFDKNTNQVKLFDCYDEKDLKIDKQFLQIIPNQSNIDDDCETEEEYYKQSIQYQCLMLNEALIKRKKQL